MCDVANRERTMREIKLSGRNYSTTKAVLEAICWATNRRGRHSWKSDDSVSTLIMEYFNDHNVYIPDLNARRIAHVIGRLVQEGYAYSKYKGSGGYGNKIVEFGFKEDVNLTGYSPTYREGVTEQIPEVLPTPSIPIPITPPPLPDIPRVRYATDEIDTLLDKWADKDPDGYADWAEKLIEHLGVILDG